MALSIIYTWDFILYAFENTAYLFLSDNFQWGKITMIYYNISKGFLNVTLFSYCKIFSLVLVNSFSSLVKVLKQYPSHFWTFIYIQSHGERDIFISIHMIWVKDWFNQAKGIQVQDDHLEFTNWERVPFLFLGFKICNINSDISEVAVISPETKETWKSSQNPPFKRVPHKSTPWLIVLTMSAPQTHHTEMAGCHFEGCSQFILLPLVSSHVLQDHQPRHSWSHISLIF